MSIPSCCALLEKHLQTMPVLATSFENVPFKPVDGLPYQRVNHLLNSPLDHAFTNDVVEFRGIMQITLCYPAGTGRQAAQNRAQLIAQTFKPPLSMTSDVRLSITRTANIKGGFEDLGRWCVPVLISWSAMLL